ncbi:hypothetical protein GZ78_09820 [Endozoicomonas numazuensis]|uniref:Protein kinase domain-containing protein n=2 Tax=Endozoicomonas numazuensis TaxID=1137799 RepID=A0A081NHJ6_9GAMM|nr:hypothetical protein GZ78_09820 [Endozoicomonas numazuensis]
MSRLLILSSLLYPVFEAQTDFSEIITNPDEDLLEEWRYDYSAGDSRIEQFINWILSSKKISSEEEIQQYKQEQLFEETASHSLIDEALQQFNQSFSDNIVGYDIAIESPPENSDGVSIYTVPGVIVANTTDSGSTPPPNIDQPENGGNDTDSEELKDPEGVVTLYYFNKQKIAEIKDSAKTFLHKNEDEIVTAADTAAVKATERRKAFIHYGKSLVVKSALPKGGSLTELQEDSSSVRRQMATEVYWLKRLNHKNVISLFGFAQIKPTEQKSKTASNSVEKLTQETTSDSDAVLTLELTNSDKSEQGSLDEWPYTVEMLFLQNGGISLQEYINDSKLNLLKPVAFIICQQLIDGIAYLHSENCVHADIKPPNIVIEHFSKPRGYSQISVKIIDFGISFRCNERSRVESGTQGFRPAEVFRPYRHGTDRSLRDVYAFSIIVFYLLAYDEMKRDDGREFQGLMAIPDDEAIPDRYHYFFLHILAITNNLIYKRQDYSQLSIDKFDIKKLAFSREYSWFLGVIMALASRTEKKRPTSAKIKEIFEKFQSEFNAYESDERL